MSRVGQLGVLRCAAIAALAVALSACAVAPTKNEDPWQGFNRKMFAFNQVADKAVVRPIAKGYVKITGPKGREHISDFFANVHEPISIFNFVLQGQPGYAVESTGRFLVNSTLGLLGFFDPASHMHLPAHTTDFAVTLARWGVPQGPYVVLPFFGPSTLRNMWSIPADYYLDPTGWYARYRSDKWYWRYLPKATYLVTLRASLLPYDKLIDSAFDPYTFVKDAYLQHRLSMNYYGNPPLSAIEALQGTTPTDESNQGINELLQQQEQYEKTHGTNPAGAPASGASAPAPAGTSGTPASAASSG
ncbi:MAG TPA: VacJ family lipoprotein [Rhodanobacteraceae bacterium]